MSNPPVLDPRERFLREIVERIPAERIAEIHLFPALRSGSQESGVAVIAAIADPAYVQGELPPPVGDSVRDEERSGAAVIETSPGDAGPPPDLEVTADPVKSADRSDPDAIETPPAVTGPSPDLESASFAADHSPQTIAGDIDSPPPPDRLVVYRAVYRWTRKGPDRGRWQVDITAEADAPLDAVGDVVRGVQRRAGEEGEPELITPDALRLALSDRPWAAAM